jgi:hypothetical protein
MQGPELRRKDGQPGVDCAWYNENPMKHPDAKPVLLSTRHELSFQIQLLSLIEPAVSVKFDHYHVFAGWARSFYGTCSKLLGGIYRHLHPSNDQQGASGSLLNRDSVN